MQETGLTCMELTVTLVQKGLKESAIREDVLQMVLLKWKRGERKHAFISGFQSLFSPKQRKEQNPKNF